MTLKELKELSNSDIMVFMPTDGPNYDVYTMRTRKKYKQVEDEEFNKYQDNEIEYLEAGGEDDDNNIILAYLK